MKILNQKMTVPAERMADDAEKDFRGSLPNRKEREVVHLLNDEARIAINAGFFWHKIGLADVGFFMRTSRFETPFNWNNGELEYWKRACSLIACAAVSIIPSFHHSIIPSFHHSIIPSFHHSIIPSFHHSIIPSFRHSIIPFCCRTKQVEVESRKGVGPLEV